MSFRASLEPSRSPGPGLPWAVPARPWAAWPFQESLGFSLRGCQFSLMRCEVKVRIATQNESGFRKRQPGKSWLALLCSPSLFFVMIVIGREAHFCKCLVSKPFKTESMSQLLFFKYITFFQIFQMYRNGFVKDLYWLHEWSESLKFTLKCVAGGSRKWLFQLQNTTLVTTKN